MAHEPFWLALRPVWISLGSHKTITNDNVMEKLTKWLKKAVLRLSITEDP